MIKTTSFVLFLCFALLVFSSSSAQNIESLVDSLRSELNNTKEDSTKSLILAELSYRLYLSPDSAYSCAVRGLELAQKLHYSAGIAANYFSLGNYYGHIEDFPKAFEYLSKALSIQLESGKTEEQLRTYFLIGTLAATHKDYNKSVRYLKEGLLLSEGRNEISIDFALLLNNLGSIYIYTKQFDSAYYYLQKGLKMSVALGSKDFEAIVLQSLGELSFASQKYVDAESFFLRSIALNENTDQRLQIINYLNLSETYLKVRNFEEALRYADMAYKLAKGFPELEINQRAARILYLIYKEKGQENIALKYLEQTSVLNDSINALVRIKEMERLQSVLDLNQKELKIKILQQENALREAELLAEKERTSNQIFITSSLIILIALISAVLLLVRKQNHVRKKLIYDLQDKNSQIFDQNNEIRLLNETLEERVEQRTASISAQKKKLEEYSFLNAHRLRGPVATLLGLLHLIDIKSIHSEELPQILDQIQGQVNQIDEVVKEINRAIE